MTKNYVSAWHDRANDIIHVVERDANRNRTIAKYQPKYEFYVYDRRGSYKSIYGEPLSKIKCDNLKQFKKELAQHKQRKTYETDLNPVFECLAEHYLDLDPPPLNIAFFDIEAAMQPFAYPSDFEVKLDTGETINVYELSRLPNKSKIKVYDHILKKYVPLTTSRYLEAGPGYASCDDPFMPITAIAVYLQWLETLVCFALVPKTMSLDQARELLAEYDDVILFTDEAEMLKAFIDLIQDVDVLSAWNGSTYDVPYTVNRIEKVLGRHYTRQLCLFDQLPKKREFEQYGKTNSSYDFIGRVHLDALEVYRKFTYEERHSYKLDAIAEYELGEHKIAYEGTLDQLYYSDFKKFVEYNRQDTLLLAKIEAKLKFIELANSIAHGSTVLLPNTIGTVAVTDQAIINEAHRLGLKIPRKNYSDENTQAAGAFVAYPKKGIHEWIGLMDINSLYPSTIRALNMSPETIVGQLEPTYTNQAIEQQIANKKSFAEAWEGLFSTIEFELVQQRDPSELITVKWVTGHSTEMTGAEIYDLIYNQNKPWMLTANGTIFTYEKEGIIPGLLSNWYAERKEFQKNARAAGDQDDRKMEAYWDKRQLVRKNNLNSLYGSILNAGSRFFDQRIGQSTTLSGRQVVKHMASEANKIITGEYDYEGDSIIYGDSVTGDTLITTEYETLTIAELFDRTRDRTKIGPKEYGKNDVKVIGFNLKDRTAVWAGINYVMRHKTNKFLYKITLANAKTITVTADHSLMIERNGTIIGIKPFQLDINDQFIYVNKDLSTIKQSFLSLECLGPVTDYVYDISIQDQDPVFFANNILVHNTDSCFFTAHPFVKSEIESGNINWTKESVIELYDQIAGSVNSTFPEFMKNTFNCPLDRGSVIKAGREIVGTRGLYITKKRYALMYYDKENKRVDVNGKPGKVKAMGLDLRRSDTPEFMQKFLSKILDMILLDHDRNEIIDAITEFRRQFKERPGWEKGSPKRVNNLTKFTEQETKQGKVIMPGHVRAAINWNMLKKMNHDVYSQTIIDGAKVIVCKLKDNPLGFTSVAYPVDELRLPDWFKELPFDHEGMESVIIDNKINNLIGVLNYDLSRTRHSDNFINLFDIED